MPKSILIVFLSGRIRLNYSCNYYILVLAERKGLLFQMLGGLDEVVGCVYFLETPRAYDVIYSYYLTFSRYNMFEFIVDLNQGMYLFHDYIRDQARR